MIHQTELVVGVGIPRPVDLDRAGGLAAGCVAQVRCDAAILSLELLNGVERRVAGEEGYGRVQSPARKARSPEARPALHIKTAIGTFPREPAISSFARLPSKFPPQGGRCRSR